MPLGFGERRDSRSAGARCAAVRRSRIRRAAPCWHRRECERRPFQSTSALPAKARRHPWSCCEPGRPDELVESAPSGPCTTDHQRRRGRRASTEALGRGVIPWSKRGETGGRPRQQRGRRAVVSPRGSRRRPAFGGRGQLKEERTNDAPCGDTGLRSSRARGCERLRRQAAAERESLTERPRIRGLEETISNDQ